MYKYVFEILKYVLVTDCEEVYKDFIKEMPPLTIEATNYIEATFKAEKRYPSNKYTHQLIDTDAEQWPTKFTLF